MSSRALRRLEKQRLGELEDEKVEEYVEARKPAVNMFALIGGDESEEEEESEEESESEESEEKVVKPAKAAKPVQKELDSDEELDRIISEIKKADLLKAPKKKIATDTAIVSQPYDESLSEFGASRQVASVGLLKVDPRDLDPDTEFRELFDDLSAEAMEDVDSMTSSHVSPQVLKQIAKMRKVVRNWGGKDRRSMPGTSRKLTLAKIRDDWIPTLKKDLAMDELSAADVLEMKKQHSDDWIDMLKQDVAEELEAGIKYFRFKEVTDLKKFNSEFYVSCVLQPDHEALMAILSSGNPYHVLSLLQVALIMVRQGDKSNSSGLVEKALFAFDRALNKFEIGNGLHRMPFEFFLNRQFYVAVFRYINILAQKGAYKTAATYSKFLLSLAPGEDPLGVRYFIDHYLILCNDNRYLIELSESPLCTVYNEWFTVGIAYSTVLAHLHQEDVESARKALARAYKQHPFAGIRLLETLGLGTSVYSGVPSSAVDLETESYILRCPMLWTKESHRNFLHDELTAMAVAGADSTDTEIPHNLLRFAVLSQESKLMAKIPSEFWDENEIFEFDVLPYGETILDFIDEKELTQAQMMRMQDDALLQQIRQVSLDRFLEENPDHGL